MFRNIVSLVSLALMPFGAMACSGDPGDPGDGSQGGGGSVGSGGSGSGGGSVSGCSAATCTPTVLSTGGKPYDLAVHDGVVYWNETGIKNGATVWLVRRLPPGATEPETVADVSYGEVRSVAAGSAGTFWSVHRNEPPNDTEITGNGVQVDGEPDVRTLALDGPDLFWARNGGDHAIMKIAVGGSVPETFVEEPADRVSDIALDDAFVYWTTWNSGDHASSALMKAPRSGGAPTVLASGKLSRGVAVDGTHVYWTWGTPGPSQVARVPKDGGVPEAIAEGLAGQVATDGVHVYWTEVSTTSMTSGRIFKAPTGGGAVVALAEGQPDPTDIAVDENYVYWINGPEGGDGAVMRIGK